jgi:hypothetical protein
MPRFGKVFGEQVGKVIFGRYVHQVEGASFELFAYVMIVGIDVL